MVFVHISLQAEGSEDGEVVDDDDCEDGEIADEEEFDRSQQQQQQQGQICRFYLRGMCTWGPQCRFVHVNERGEPF